MTLEPLTGPLVAGNELDTLLGALERNRRVLAWKCADLDAAAMAITVGTSAITLGGLLRHLSPGRDQEDSPWDWYVWSQQRASLA